MLTPTSRGSRDRKRLARVAVVAATITALSAGAASAQEGAPGFEIKDELAEVTAEGHAFETKLSPDGLRVEISDESFGFPEADFPIQRSAQDPGLVGPNLRPFVCENGTYRLVSGIFRGHAARVEHRAAAASPTRRPSTAPSRASSRRLSSCFRAQRESARASSVAPPLNDLEVRRRERSTRLHCQGEAGVWPDQAALLDVVRSAHEISGVTGFRSQRQSRRGLVVPSAPLQVRRDRRHETVMRGKQD